MVLLENEMDKIKDNRLRDDRFGNLCSTSIKYYNIFQIEEKLINKIVVMIYIIFNKKVGLMNGGKTKDIQDLVITEVGLIEIC